MKKLTLECQLFVGLYQSINQSINLFAKDVSLSLYVSVVADDIL